MFIKNCVILKILITSRYICSVFIYFHWYLKKDDVSVKFNPRIKTTIY